MKLTIDQLRVQALQRQRTMEIPDLGEVVVKLFTKAEFEALQTEATRLGEVRTAELERLLLQRGLLDPPLSDADVATVSEQAALYYLLLNAVLEANGLTELARRQMRRSFRDGA